MNKIDNIQKTLAIVCFISIIICNIIAYLNPAKGYELSIYDSTPTIVWILLCANMICGIFLIVYNVYNSNTNNHLWIYGFLILILSRITIICIPFVRGYYTWYGDGITHIGLARDILLNGHTTLYNSYPISHIFVSSMTYITTLPLEVVTNNTVIIFNLIFIMFLYLISKRLFPSKKVSLLTAAAVSCVLLTGYEFFFVPNGYSLLYLPVLIYLYIIFHKSFNKSLLLLFVTVMLLFPFFHPVSALIIILNLIIFNTFYVFISACKNDFKRYIQKYDFILLLLMIVVLVIWILSVNTFDRSMESLYNTISGNTVSSSAIHEMGTQLNKVNVQGIDLVILFIKMMSDKVIFFTFSIVALYILYVNRYSIKELLQIFPIFSFTFSSCMFYLIYLFNIIPGIAKIGFQRSFYYLIIFSPIFVGVVMDYVLTKKTIIIPILCISILSICSFISIYHAYPSPFIIQQNNQVTNSDMYGIKWFAENKNQDIKTYSLLTSPARFADAYLGVTESNNRIDLQSYNLIPNHFGYDKYSHIGDNMTDRIYLTFDEDDRVVYNTVWRSVGRYLTEDFVKLESDDSANKLYSNGQYYIYLI